MIPDRNSDLAAGVAGALAATGLAPLSARSLIASLLLGMDEPAMRPSDLVRWCALFGVREGTARVALSRMVDRGELTAGDGYYVLAGRVRARRPAQDFSLAPRLLPWEGSWRIGVVRGEARSADARAALRDAMRRLRFAERREGLWLRPDNLPPEAAPRDAVAVAAEQCEWWRGAPEGSARRLADELFTPGEWARRARDLDGLLGRASERLRVGDDAGLAPAFVLGAATLQHLRADPLLPPDLVPGAAAGARLRARYVEFRDAFGAALREWFRPARA
jgi:phenylacetic acid degradation operon negative regulatory protein